MKKIIFDWSGVVKDALKAQVWVTNKIFAKHGLLPLSLEQFKEDWEQPYNIFYNKYLPTLSLEEEQKDYLEAILSPECPKSTACPGMVELIKHLKNRGYFMAVVSSDHPETILREISAYGLDNIFTEIVTNVHDKLESVQNIIRKNNLNLADTYFIGDSNHEVEVAQKLGVKSIAVTWGLCNEKRLKSVKPDYLISEVSDLENLLA
jgi:phosphoglycolate phosphatase-like HAD superfamily hydrolase